MSERLTTCPQQLAQGFVCGHFDKDPQETQLQLPDTDSPCGLSLRSKISPPGESEVRDSGTRPMRFKIFYVNISTEKKQQDRSLRKEREG